MKPFLIKPALSLKGVFSLPGDKSIAHRAVILSALSCGKSVIKNFPSNKDCSCTINVFKKLGISIKEDFSAGSVSVLGKGIHGLGRPEREIFLGESGTTARLLLGVLAGQPFKVKLAAAPSLSRRPMLRVTAPLRMMGAKISSSAHQLISSQDEEYLPLTIHGGSLKPISYKMPVASAQVKSAILLAGLFAKGATKVIEPLKTRDHTERMLRLFNAEIKVSDNTIVVRGGKELAGRKEIYVPGDISSASYFVAAAALLPGSEILLKGISLNPSRIGILRVLRKMGARIQVSGAKSQAPGSEPMGNIKIRYGSLKGVTVKKKETPSLIDELPVLMVAASLSKGRTVLEGVGELRVKETDRVASMTQNLKKMGADIRIVKAKRNENIVIEGVKQLSAAKVRSFGDHRTAMSMVIAGLAARGETRIDDVSCIDKSFPEFLSLLKRMTR